MEIIGYSERGAMNALFYGMAHDEDPEERSMKEFLKLAGIKESFSHFELYSEFSLSEFGNPDMMIIAKDNKGDNVVFFIEAKASCCDGYKLSLEIEHHTEYMKGGNTNDASNLFFQLRLKHYFFLLLPAFYRDPDSLEQKQNTMFIDEDENIKIKRLKTSRNRNRQIGKNAIVKKMVEKIQECNHAYYIAIIPKQDSKQKNKIVRTDDYINAYTDEYKEKDAFKFETHTITWEDIYDCKDYDFKHYLQKTFEFNQNKDENKKGKLVSQILNKPI